VVRKHRSGQQGAFETMRRPRMHDAARRHVSFATQLEIDREGVEIVLNVLRSRKLLKAPALMGGQAGFEAFGIGHAGVWDFILSSMAGGSWFSDGVVLRVSSAKYRMISQDVRGVIKSESMD
jgi:hypothetical protein